MHGQPEKIEVSSDGQVIEVCRGEQGVALINIGEEAVDIDMPTLLKQGKYTDKVHGATFEVNDGVIKGEMQPLTSYILY